MSYRARLRLAWRYVWATRPLLVLLVPCVALAAVGTSWTDNHAVEAAVLALGFGLYGTGAAAVTVPARVHAQLVAQAKDQPPGM